MRDDSLDLIYLELSELEKEIKKICQSANVGRYEIFNRLESFSQEDGDKVLDLLHRSSKLRMISGTYHRGIDD